MTGPVKADTLDPDSVLLARRFSREQGKRADGSLKLRAVDDLTSNGVNECTQPQGKPVPDSVDALVRAMVALKTATGKKLALWKADVDSAYRRVPARASDRWALWVALLSTDGVPRAARHNALPFGGVGSVHGWDRLGAFFKHLARELLFLIVFRYVDDYFGVEYRSTAEHAMECFARLVRAVLGPSAIAPSKLAHGMPLDILGLQVNVSKKGIQVRVTPEKAEQWGKLVKEALTSGILAVGDASKMAGRLSFLNTRSGG